MLTEEIMERYELARDWRSAGFYETENHAQIAHAVRSGLASGRLIAITCQRRSNFDPLEG